MTFGALKEMALIANTNKNKSLLQVTVKGRQDDLPTFRILNIHALENQLRRARSNVTDEIFSIVDLQNFEAQPKRVREKSFTVSEDLSSDFIERTVKKARSELSKGNLVRLHVKGDSEEDETKNFEKSIKEKILQGELESHAQYLFISIAC